MPFKKQQKNAFYFFMIDYKKKHEAEGRNFPGGLREVSSACNDEWQKMTPRQKGPYESRAKDAKIRNGLSDVKYTSQGVPISLIEKEAKRKQDYEDNMNDYIRVVVDMSTCRESLIEKRFYFIHVNWLCRKVLANGEGDFYPAEFAVAEFSLENGVRNIYHEIINIDVPLGYTFEATKHASETHKIDKNLSGGQSNFGFMYQSLRNLLKPETIGEELPPLYTTRGVMEIVPGLLSRMAKAAGRSLDIFRVYSIETLFFHIRNATAAYSNEEGSIGFPTFALAEAEIAKDRFDRAAGIACDYHNEMDETTIHCSRSIVIRWAYIICDFCCMDVDVEMEPGSHCPLNTDAHIIRKSKENVFKGVFNHMSLASMTGVTDEYRQRTSERTYREERERRQNSQPLQVIDHSKLQESNKQEVRSASKPTASIAPSYSNPVKSKVGRPLRLPTTKSWAIMGAETGQVPNMDEMNFPAIGGRGSSMKKKIDNHFPPIGRGRGLPFGN